MGKFPTPACFAPLCNGTGEWNVYPNVRKRLLWFVPLLVVVLAASPANEYQSARQKFDLISSDRLKPGSRVELTPQELNAYVSHELPDGVRNPHLRITAPGVATGSAIVDFVKARRAQGHPPGWLMSRLLDGERPVSVTAHIRSANGSAQVDVDSVEISGMVIDGGMLDFLVRNVLLPLYPDAAVGRPFDLGHRIQRLDIQPRAVGVVIGK